MLIRIVAPHFVAGIILDDYDFVCETAPILHYMLSWSYNEVKRHCVHRGWTYEEV